MKLSTTVNAGRLEKPFRLTGKTVLLGSCFADGIGAKMSSAGFEVCTNPFGTLYNPASIANAVRRLDGSGLYTAGDCVPMGAGAGRICSFEHHTSFARPEAAEFLTHANGSLLKARDFWRSADRVIITLGTAMTWISDGRVVSNCLKRPASEFVRRMMEVDEIRVCLQQILDSHPKKRFLFTVSPIRHLGDGAHTNAISKARLLLACDACIGADYFPAYEILLDELRDYRFYAEDLVHPSSVATDIIWERFLESCVCPEDLAAIAANEKAARRSAHRPNLE